MPPLHWSRHEEKTQRAGWQEIRAEVSEGWKEGAAKMKETSTVSVSAGLWATMSHQKSLSVPWHRVWICRAGGIFSHILPQEIPPFRVLLMVVGENSLRHWHRILGCTIKRQHIVYTVSMFIQTCTDNCVSVVLLQSRILVFKSENNDTLYLQSASTAYVFHKAFTELMPRWHRYSMFWPFCSSLSPRASIFMVPAPGPCLSWGRLISIPGKL